MDEQLLLPRCDDTRYRGLICTLRHLIAPPGAPFSRLPNWREIGPSVNWRCWTSAVLVPLRTTVRFEPLAVISKVFHLPPAFGIGDTLETSTIAPVLYSCPGR